MPLVSVHISYPAAQVAPLRYVTKLTSSKLSVPLFRTDEGDPDGFDVELEQFSYVHQETRAVYTGGETQLVIVKDFQVDGILGAPRDIEVTWDDVCVPAYLPLKMVVEGVEYDGVGEGVPSPDGQYELSWKPAAQEWQYIQDLGEEWAPGRQGFLFAAYCTNGEYYRRVNIWPSGEPIGGGLAILNEPLVLDSGGGDFNLTGTATIKFEYNEPE